MDGPSNARLFALLEQVASALSAEDVAALFRRIGADLGEQEALDLRVTVARALRSYVEARKPGRQAAGELSEEEHERAALDALADAGDVLAEVEAALTAGALTRASVHAAELERLAGRLRSHAEQGGRHRCKP